MLQQLTLSTCSQYLFPPPAPGKHWSISCLYWFALHRSSFSVGEKSLNWTAPCHCPNKTNWPESGWKTCDAWGWGSGFLLCGSAVGSVSSGTLGWHGRGWWHPQVTVISRTSESARNTWGWKWKPILLWLEPTSVIFLHSWDNPWGNKSYIHE